MYKLAWQIAQQRGAWLVLGVLLLPLLVWSHSSTTPLQTMELSIDHLVSKPALTRYQVENRRLAHNIHVSTQAVDVSPLQPNPVAPVIFRVATNNPVFFITIDDGVTKRTDVARYITDYQLPVTAFLTIHNIQNQFDYFLPLQAAGMGIQDHTVNHPHLRGLPVERQHQEICDTATILAQQYGKSPILFRPPYGEYDDKTQIAAAECGQKAVVWWSATMYQGILTYQPPNTHLLSGDIILLHFHPGLKHDLELLLQTANQQGLQLGRLEDYLR